VKKISKATMAFCALYSFIGYSQGAPNAPTSAAAAASKAQAPITNAQPSTTATLPTKATAQPATQPATKAAEAPAAKAATPNALPAKTIYDDPKKTSGNSAASSASTPKLAPPAAAPTFTNSSSSEPKSDIGTVSPADLKAENLDDQVKLLEELVNISSDSKLEVEGVDKIQTIVERELKDMNFKVELIPSPDPYNKVGNLLVASLAGKSEQFITLVAHADTVFPANLGFAKFKKTSELEATGPGVIDDKGGLVVALEGLKMYLEQNPTPAFSLRLIVSPSEEVGSAGFLDYFNLASLTSVAIFGMEPAIENGDIVDSRKGDRWYEVSIHGREAHSGRAHEVGVNACHELAIKIEKLQKLTNYKKEVTINIGAIKGGKDKYAIVCGEASMKLDVRFADTKNRARILKSVEDILKGQFVRAKSDGARAVTEWKIVDDPQPYPADPAAKNLIEIYKKVVFDLEATKIVSKRSGGTSDLNYFYRPGLIVLDGLGPMGSGMHTTEEKVALKTLQTRAKALSKLIQAASL
jgi:glutamate carboxypeptidase